MSKMIEFLNDEAKKNEIELSDIQLGRFQVYYDLLIETNKFLNLTAITEMHEVVLKHFIDSMMISKFYDLSNCSIIDIGTGAGFPGIPLAILYPDSEFVLLDSLQKRLSFIDQVLKSCGIDNVSLIHGRAEDFAHDKKYREQFDFCVSRAVAALPTLLELCIPYVKIGGLFISYKSGSVLGELENAKNAMELLFCKFKKMDQYEISDLDINRVYVSFEKRKVLSKKYPRQAGKPKKSPL